MPGEGEITTTPGPSGTGGSTPGWGGGPTAVQLPAPLWRALKWAGGIVFAALFVGHGRSPYTADNVAVLCLEAAGLCALIWRAKRPVAVLAFVTAVLVACDVVSGQPEPVRVTLLAFAAYSVVVRRPARLALALVSVAWLAVSAADLAVGGALNTPLAPDLAVVVAGVASGLFIGSQRVLLSAAHERAEQAERERNYHAERALSEERVRIARDLHDIVAHHVSLLVVQAGAVRESLGPAHPAREVLDSMIEGGRQAMSELRAMLGALRGTDLSKEDGDAPRGPHPSVEDIVALVEGAAKSGVPVKFESVGAPDGLPPAVGLAAYRIVQEALTNVVKHAPGADTTVTVDRRRDGVFLRVVNGRPLIPVPASSAETGHGLMGMAERAAHYHGWVKAEPAGEGFRVEAWLGAQDVTTNDWGQGP